MDYKGMDKKRNREVYKEIISVIWVRNDGGLDQISVRDIRENQIDLGYILRVLLMGFVGRLDM